MLRLRKARGLVVANENPEAQVAVDARMSGLSGKQIALFVGGGFVAMLIIFYLIANWDSIANGFLCWAQTQMGQKTHFHIPMKGGGAYSCSKATTGSNVGVAGDGNA